jgi:hypothetical protein
MGPETKNYCAGEDQQQFTRRTAGWLWVSIRSWWLTVSTEAKESPLLEAPTKQRTVKKEQIEKTECVLQWFIVRED